jgi:hypothetical protein
LRCVPLDNLAIFLKTNAARRAERSGNLVSVPLFFGIRDESAVACKRSGDHGAENEVDRAEECVPPGANQPGNFRWAKLLFDGFSYEQE